MERWGNVLTGWTKYSQGYGLVSFRNRVIITNLVYLIYRRRGGSGMGVRGSSPNARGKDCELVKNEEIT